MLAKAFVVLQYLLPRHWLTGMMHRIARIRSAGIKDFLINRFVRIYDVDVAEVKLEPPQDFATFNDFFTRELKEGARVIDDSADALVSPVDGTVSIAGSLQAGRLLQAKGLHYTLDDLLATDLEESAAYIDGRFATIYLAPYNYHRVHAPFDGELLVARYVPGDLFSVNAATVASISGLFRRNERLIMHFRTAHGPAALVFVGALNVGSISTPWSGEIRPRKTGSIDTIDLSTHPALLRKGDLLGWFNFGSTVILILPKQRCEWLHDLQAGKTLRMGEAIGRYTRASR